MPRSKIYLSLVVLTPLFLTLSSAIVLAGPSLSFDPMPSGSIIEMMQHINSSMLLSYLSDLLEYQPRYTGSENCTKAAVYLYNTFKDMGLDVEYHNWSYDGFKASNIIATIPGMRAYNNETYVLCAHYDTTPTSPGADDDGSGVAALLSIANVLRSRSFNYTICFIAFSGEEVGTYGSFSYARDAYRRGDNIVAVLNADMIGYADTSIGEHTLRFFPCERAWWIGEYATMVADKYHDILDLDIEVLPNYIGSDAQPFIDYGYDAVWIAHRDGYPYGHSVNDTIDHINPVYYEKASRLLLAVISELASTPIRLQVILCRPMEGYFYIRDEPLVKLNLGRYWHKGLRGTTIIIGETVATSEVFTNDSIKYVIYCMNGNFLFNWNNTPPYMCHIKGVHYPFFGRYTLKVYAYTTDGDVASDEMDVRIYTLSSIFNKRK
ncbi:MAG: M28 family peptidase [Candidatus Thermoplasmatota archaeon]